MRYLSINLFLPFLISNENPLHEIFIEVHELDFRGLFGFMVRDYSAAKPIFFVYLAHRLVALRAFVSCLVEEDYCLLSVIPYIDKTDTRVIPHQ
jgi:hypothetical protein